MQTQSGVSVPPGLPLRVPAALLQGREQADAEDPHRDTGVPSMHVAPLSGWGSDPHGPIFYKGRYHLFYQARPGTCQWFWGMRWEHCVSTDLVTWLRLPPALLPTPGGLDADGCFTGNIQIHPATGVPMLFYTGARLRHNPTLKHPDPPLEACNPLMFHWETQLLAVCDPDDELMVNWRKVDTPWMELPHCAYLSSWRDPFFVPPELDPATGLPAHELAELKAKVVACPTSPQLVNAYSALTNAHSVLSLARSARTDSQLLGAGTASQLLGAGSASQLLGAGSAVVEQAAGGSDDEADTESAAGGTLSTTNSSINAPPSSVQAARAAASPASPSLTHPSSNNSSMASTPTAAAAAGHPGADTPLPTTAPVNVIQEESSGEVSDGAATTSTSSMEETGTPLPSPDPLALPPMTMAAPTPAPAAADAAVVGSSGDADRDNAAFAAAATQPTVDGQGREHMMLIGSGLEGLGGTALIYRSADLASGWRFDGYLCTWPNLDTGLCWECPHLLNLPDLPQGLSCIVDTTGMAAQRHTAATTTTTTTVTDEEVRDDEQQKLLELVNAAWAAAGISPSQAIATWDVTASNAPSAVAAHHAADSGVSAAQPDSLTGAAAKAAAADGATAADGGKGEVAAAPAGPEDEAAAATDALLLVPPLPSLDVMPAAAAAAEPPDTWRNPLLLDVIEGSLQQAVAATAGASMDGMPALPTATSYTAATVTPHDTNTPAGAAVAAAIAAATPSGDVNFSVTTASTGTTESAGSKPPLPPGAAAGAAAAAAAAAAVPAAVGALTPVASSVAVSYLSEPAAPLQTRSTGLGMALALSRQNSTASEEDVQVMLMQAMTDAVVARRQTAGAAAVAAAAAAAAAAEAEAAEAVVQELAEEDEAAAREGAAAAVALDEDVDVVGATVGRAVRSDSLAAETSGAAASLGPAVSGISSNSGLHHAATAPPAAQELLVQTIMAGRQQQAAAVAASAYNTELNNACNIAIAEGEEGEEGEDEDPHFRPLPDPFAAMAAAPTTSDRPNGSGAGGGAGLSHLGLPPLAPVQTRGQGTGLAPRMSVDAPSPVMGRSGALTPMASGLGRSGALTPMASGMASGTGGLLSPTLSGMAGGGGFELTSPLPSLAHSVSMGRAGLGHTNSLVDVKALGEASVAGLGYASVLSSRAPHDAACMMEEAATAAAQKLMPTPPMFANHGQGFTREEIRAACRAYAEAAAAVQGHDLGCPSSDAPVVRRCKQGEGGVPPPAAPNQRWMLGLAPDAATYGILYFLGNYTHNRFHLDSAAGPFKLDMGNSLYAPVAYYDRKHGRHIVWGYLKELRRLPPPPSMCNKYISSGCVSIPRALYLHEGRLHQVPLPELARLRTGRVWQQQGVRVAEGLAAGLTVPPEHGGDAVDLQLVVRRGSAESFALLLHSWLPEGEGEAALRFSWATRKLEVVYGGLNSSGNQATEHCLHNHEPLPPQIGGVHTVEGAGGGSAYTVYVDPMVPPVPELNPDVPDWIRMKPGEAGGELWLEEGQPLRLRVFIDASAVEVFTGTGQVLCTRVYRGCQQQGAVKSSGLQLVALGGSATVEDVQVHETRSAWLRPEDEPLPPPVTQHTLDMWRQLGLA